MTNSDAMKELFLLIQQGTWREPSFLPHGEKAHVSDVAQHAFDSFSKGKLFETWQYLEYARYSFVTSEVQRLFESIAEQDVAALAKKFESIDDLPAISAIIPTIGDKEGALRASRFVPHGELKIASLVIWRVLRYLVTSSLGSEDTHAILSGLSEAMSQLAPALRSKLWWSVVASLPKILGRTSPTAQLLQRSVFELAISSLASDIGAPKEPELKELETAISDSDVAKQLLSAYRARIVEKVQEIELHDFSTMTEWDNNLIEATGMAMTLQPELLDTLLSFCELIPEDDWRADAGGANSAKTAWIITAISFCGVIDQDRRRKGKVTKSDALVAAKLSSLVESQLVDTAWGLDNRPLADECTRAVARFGAALGADRGRALVDAALAATNRATTVAQITAWLRQESWPTEVVEQADKLAKECAAYEAQLNS
jgi:hypothetical protein